MRGGFVEWEKAQLKCAQTWHSARKRGAARQQRPPIRAGLVAPLHGRGPGATAHLRSDSGGARRDGG